MSLRSAKGGDSEKLTPQNATIVVMFVRNTGLRFASTAVRTASLRVRPLPIKAIMLASRCTLSATDKVRIRVGAPTLAALIWIPSQPASPRPVTSEAVITMRMITVGHADLRLAPTRTARTPSMRGARVRRSLRAASEKASSTITPPVRYRSMAGWALRNSSFRR